MTKKNSELLERLNAGELAMSDPREPAETCEQKSTCIGITHAIDGHIRSRNSYREARQDLETILEHVTERLESLREFYSPVSRENGDR